MQRQSLLDVTEPPIRSMSTWQLGALKWVFTSMPVPP